MIISSGLKNAATKRERPIIRPTGTAKTSASAKPIAMRRIESRMLSSDSLSVRMPGNSRKRCVRGRQAGDVERARGDFPDGEQAGEGEQRGEAGDGGEAGHGAVSARAEVAAPSPLVGEGIAERSTSSVG